MIGKVRGRVVKGPPKVLLELPLGLSLEIITPLYRELEGEVELYTVMRCSQGKSNIEFRLYGFLSEREKELFSRLVEVRNLGPSKALNILSYLSVEEFEEVVRAGDYVRLSMVPGIGRKMAKRILGEMEEGLTVSDGGVVFDALKALGYSKEEISRAMRKVDLRGLSEEEALKELLRVMDEGDSNS